MTSSTWWAHSPTQVPDDRAHSRPVRSELSLPLAVTSLMKGVVYRDTHEKAWRHLTALQSRVRDYVATIGLALVVDEAEGYAFLRSKPDEDDAGSPGDGADGPHPDISIPRLIPRRSLSLHVSLLLALLRKKLAEFDAQAADTKLVLHRDQIVDLIRIFLPSGNNEARLVDQIDAHIGKVVELGFLRKVKDDNAYEVRRVLKAFVDAQWLAELDDKLAEYVTALTGTDRKGGGNDG